LKAAAGERVRLILANIGYEFHTPHLHGHTWQELNAGNLRSTPVEDPNGVRSIGPAEIKIVEFTAKHTGTWLFHCHVVPHVADNGKYPQGMLTILKVTDEKIKATSQTIPTGVAEREKTDLPKDPQVASLPPFQPFDYPGGLADQGYDVYTKNCKSCHGVLGKGEYGPKLQENSILDDDSKYWKTVLKGKGNMPAWENELSFQQIADVQAYLKTLKPPSP
jgi:hypothetical protein